jgi:hypothetical protein
MNYKQTLFVTVALGAIFIAAALIVRSGLVSIATAVRDKPLPSLPESIGIQELTIRQATLEASSSTGTNHNVNVRIDNMHVDAQVPKTNDK